MTIATEGPVRPTVVCTADARFDGLVDFPFQPHYAEVEHESFELPLRMHYVDEGPRDGPVILMLHGEPSWSYLYRTMIPVFSAGGYRAIAPDLIGFGRSDKPTWSVEYTMAGHIGWLASLVEQLDLSGITLVCQDWGGPIGLGVLARMTERFSHVVAGNTMLHTAAADLVGQIDWAVHQQGEFDVTVNMFLLDWMRHSQRSTQFNASDSLPVATARPVNASTIAAYDAPFPSEWHKAGMRQFPLLIPVTPGDPGALINRTTWEVLANFEKPFLTLFGDSDPPTRGWEKIFQTRVPGAAGQPHRVLSKAGHFWQEDCGAEAAQMIIEWRRAC